MSWNRQYRPQAVSQLHLKSVRSFFEKLLAGDNFPQVFLFSGPKGTGKTSTARIIGALLNDEKNSDRVKQLFFKEKGSAKKLIEPDASTKISKDIISGQSYLVQELDAASNRGIDDVRALKERVQLPPVQGLISVYILDEVHMLTTEAFNALLKLLEEPPKHVVFILATTEQQKVPETVVSRCQVINFTQASQAELTAAIKNVASAEKLSLQPEIIEFIAKNANGSFRDAIKLVEQAAQAQANTLAEIQQLVGSNYSQQLEVLISAVLNKDSGQVVTVFQQLRASGSSESSFHRDLIGYLHQQLLVGLGVEDGDEVVPPAAAKYLLTQLADASLSLPSGLAFLRLELKLLEIIDKATKQSSPGGNTAAKKTKPEPKKSKTVAAEITQPKKISETTMEMHVQPEQKSSQTVSNHLESTDIDPEQLTGNGQQLVDEWTSFVDQVSQSNFSLGTLLKSARPVSGDVGQLTLSVFYRFHQEQLQHPKFTEQLNGFFVSNFGGAIKINCVLAEQPVEAELSEPDITSNLEKLAVDALM